MPAGRRARRCSAHTSASPASLKRRTILGQLAARSPRHHEASDGNGAFARTVSAIPGPSTRMAAATSATSRVSTNATLSSPACPPQVGGSPWWESVRTISASTCASPASLFPPDTWPSWPVPPQQRAGPRWPAACCRGAGVPTARRLAACHSLGPGSAWSPRGVLCAARRPGQPGTPPAEPQPHAECLAWPRHGVRRRLQRGMRTVGALNWRRALTTGEANMGTAHTGQRPS